MRVKNFDIGVESITRWDRHDEVHLPKDGPRKPTFLPEARPLDAVLRRPSLDERLPGLLQPSHLDPDLLEPATLTDVRVALQTLFTQKAKKATGAAREVFGHASRMLDSDVHLDDEVRTALAMLLRG
jgi:hypothetical protein